MKITRLFTTLCYLLLKVEQRRSRCMWSSHCWMPCICRMQQYIMWIAFTWCALSMPSANISLCPIISPRRSYWWLSARCCTSRSGSSFCFYWTLKRAAAISAISSNTFWLAQILCYLLHFFVLNFNFKVQIGVFEWMTVHLTISLKKHILKNR